MTNDTTPAPIGADALRTVASFLLGEGQLRGVSYGEKPDGERGKYWWRKDLRAALASAAQPAAVPTRAQIREVFLSSGFTVKEGQTDLKEYVYKAAYALLAIAAAPKAAPAPAAVAGPVAWLHDDPQRYDVIHAEVKDLLVKSRDAAGHLHRPLDKSAHYTIPLYATPTPAAQGDALDPAFEAVRQRLCELQRYSFVLDDDGVVRRVRDRVGNWIEFDDANALFDPVAVDAARAAKEGDKP